MLKAVQYTRQTTALSPDQAILAGLAMREERPQDNPGLRGAVFKRVSNSNADRRMPVVLTLTISPQTFHLLKGRVHFVVPGHEADKREYVRVTTFEDFEKPGFPKNEVLIKLAKLPHEDLVKLGIQMGFRDDTGYKVQTYGDWCEELQVRTRTPDTPRISVEGAPASSQMRR